MTPQKDVAVNARWTYKRVLQVEREPLAELERVLAEMMAELEDSMNGLLR
jgi:hypothetical protein